MLVIPGNREELAQRVQGDDTRAILGFFGSFSMAAMRSRPVFERFARDAGDVPVILVDLDKLKGAHKDFGVKQVPTVVLVEGGKVRRSVIGPHDADYWSRALLQDHVVRRDTGEDDKPSHRVVLYTGEHCPWCARARNYLRRNRVRFTEIMVSKDPAAAQALMAKTGQTGVPQLDIDGHYIVGFDKPRIAKLLGLPESAA